MISAAKVSSSPTAGQHLLLAFLLAPLTLSRTLLAFSLTLLVFSLTLLAACGYSPEPLTLQGATMGTRYHVTLAPGPERMPATRLQAGIESVLERIEDSMSTWREDSEISRFNRAPAAEWSVVSADFLEVFSLARTVARGSAGAYDVSVAPLVELWGFGPGASAEDSVPGQAQIDAAMQQVGEAWVEVDSAGRRLRKLRPLTLDFSSIAKGYAVDKLVGWLEQQGYLNYMVEIGGEIRVRGHSPRGTPWRIAIEKPEPAAREVAALLAITDQAVATSGDYRNFFEVDGIRYSHSIDPRSGRPVQHQLVSVTVVASNAALADAWATALTVLGPEPALQTALREGLAVYLISRDASGLRVDKTPAIAAYLQ